MDISGCCGRKIRFPAVAGTFYPADKDELAQELKSYYKEAESMVKPLEDAQTAMEGSSNATNTKFARPEGVSKFVL